MVNTPHRVHLRMLAFALVTSRCKDLIHVQVLSFQEESAFRARGGGGGGTPIYWLYWNVPLERVWFSSHLAWYRV